MKNLVINILENLKPVIQNLIDAHVAQFEKKFERKMSKFDLTMSELYIISDMVKSVEKYTSHDDVLVSLGSSVSKKGNLEISALIERGGTEYRLTTEVIYAGGHNIQCLHYRYITNSKLPKTGNNILTTEYAEKIKKMTKLEKLNEQLETEYRWQKRYEEEITQKEAMSEDEIIEHLKIEKPYALYSEKYLWKNLNEQAKEWYGSEELFEQKSANDLKNDISEFKHHLKVRRRYLKDVNKAIEKTKAKITEL